ncbi:hypothetical protein [Powai lake megavirus]|uniref:Uncharacterized protein n=1 Tax=Powai lake megavirus TaxID=1842663 RepID=A0A167RBQ4_9VIRU|nr:hypothetical protein QJ849_gp345 [Powai lake megavirus]ANB50507.1 hypothetical protein [Powai lake megavirus]
MDMSESDIKKYLTNKNISKQTRKQMENRLAVIGRNNLYDILNNVSEVDSNEEQNFVSKKTNRKTKRFLREKKTEQSIQVQQSEKNENNDTVCNSETTTNINASEIPVVLNYGDAIKKVEVNEPIFSRINLVDGKLVVSYHDLTQIYQLFAIYRIKMQYLILNRKIHVLNSMHIINPIKANKFKQILAYDEMCKQEQNMKNCIDICMDLNQLLECYKLCIDFLILARRTSKHTDEYKNSLNIFISKYHKIQDLEIYFFDESENIYANYRDTIIKLVDQMKYVYEKYTIINQQEALILSSKISVMYFEVDKLMSEILSNNDVNIDCEYYIIITDDINNPIKPYAIRNFTYIYCHDDITLSTMNINLDDLRLNNMTIQDFDNMFNQIDRNNEDDFIRIYKNNNGSFECINFNFDLQYPISGPNIKIEISDLPINVFVSTSIIHNEFIESNNIGVSPTFSRKYNWINHTAYDEHDKMTLSDYEYLSNIIKCNKTQFDTDTIPFVMEYVFENLIGSGHNIINQNMYDSFVSLAQQTSYYGMVEDI